MSAALAANERRQTPSSGVRTRAALEARLGHPVDVIVIRCSGHSVNGKVKTPRAAYAVRLDSEGGWEFGGTLSAALDLDTNSARSPWANAVRSDSYTAKRETGHEREVISCPGCPDRFVFKNGARIAAALASFLEDGQHTVTLAELRDRY